MAFTGNPGRFAGSLYVLTSIVGFFAMGYGPDRILLPHYQNKVYTYTQPAVIGESSSCSGCSSRAPSRPHCRRSLSNCIS